MTAPTRRRIPAKTRPTCTTGTSCGARRAADTLTTTTKIPIDLSFVSAKHLRWTVLKSLHTAMMQASLLTPERTPTCCSSSKPRSPQMCLTSCTWSWKTMASLPSVCCRMIARGSNLYKCNIRIFARRTTMKALWMGCTLEGLAGLPWTWLSPIPKYELMVSVIPELYDGKA